MQGEQMAVYLADLSAMLSLSPRAFGMERLALVRPALSWLFVLISVFVLSTGLGTALAPLAWRLVFRRNCWKDARPRQRSSLLQSTAIAQMQYAGLVVVAIFSVKLMASWACSPSGPLTHVSLWLLSQSVAGSDLLAMATGWLVVTLRPERVGIVHAMPPLSWLLASAVAAGLQASVHMNFGLARMIHAGQVSIAHTCICGYPYSAPCVCPECGKTKESSECQTVRWRGSRGSVSIKP